jgi:hypothetical protein
MTYDQLLEWVKSKGRTEQDLKDFETYGNATSLQDLPVEELAREIRKGIKEPTSEQLKDWWDALSEVDQKEFLTYYEEHFKQFPNGM